MRRAIAAESFDGLGEQAMQNSSWVALLRHIPAEQHNQYTLTTTSGIEITLQALLRIEQEFVVLKGRLAGSQDAGRIFFVPYEHIDYFGTLQPMKDSDFNEVFNSLVLPSPATTAAQAELPAILPQAGQGRPDSGQRPTIRSEVLDRYRGRPSSAAILPTGKPNGT
jgi:hypothetical protein